MRFGEGPISLKIGLSNYNDDDVVVIVIIIVYTSLLKSTHETP